MSRKQLTSRTFLPARGQVRHLILSVLFAAAISGFGAGASAQWGAIPDGLSNDAPAIQTRSGAIDVYVRGLDNQFYYKYWSSFTGWLPWSAVGGIFSSKPSIATHPSVDKTFVVGRGQDGSFYIRWLAHTSSSAWQRIGTTRFLGGPAIAFYDGNLWLFGRGEDQRLYVAKNPVPASGVYTHANWTAFSALGTTQFSSDPAATVWGSRLVVSARDSARGYRYATTFGSTWSAFAVVSGGVFSSEPSLTVNSAGSLVVYGRGLDGFYWRNSYNGSTWTGVSQLNARTFDSAPAATYDASTHNMIVIGTSLDEVVYLRWVP